MSCMETRTKRQKKTSICLIYRWNYWLTIVYIYWEGWVEELWTMVG